MIDGINVSLTGQVALEHRLTSLAQNVANSRTVGFRATQIRFQEEMKTANGEKISMVSKGEEVLSTNSGGFEKTGNDLDLAIDGDAWFSVKTPAGNVMTKDGRFQVTAQGALVNLAGNAVLDGGGAPIQVDAAGGRITVSGAGVLQQAGKIVGGVGLFAFDPGVNFQRYGESGILSNASVEPIVDPSQAGVLQGYIEQSNVNPVQEITKLITVQRSFEQEAAVIDKSNNSLDALIQALNRS